MKKVSITGAELKKSVAYKKIISKAVFVFIDLTNDQSSFLQERNYF